MLIATRNNFDDTCMVLDTEDGVEEKVSYDLLRSNPSVKVVGITSHDLSMGTMSPIRLKWVDSSTLRVYKYDGFFFDEDDTQTDINYYDLNISGMELSKEEFKNIIDIIQNRAENKILVPSFGNYSSYPSDYEIIGNIDDKTGLVSTISDFDLSYFSVLGIILDEKKSVKGLTEFNKQYAVINGQILSGIDYMYSIYLNSTNNKVSLSDDSKIIRNSENENNLNVLKTSSFDFGVILNNADNEYTISEFGIPLFNLLSSIRPKKENVDDTIYVNKPSLIREGVTNYSLAGNSVPFDEVVNHFYSLVDDEMRNIIKEDLEKYTMKKSLAGHKVKSNNFFKTSILFDYPGDNITEKLPMGYGIHANANITCINFHGHRLEIHNDDSDKFFCRGMVSSRITYVGWEVLDFFNCSLVIGDSNDSDKYDFRSKDYSDKSNIVNYIISKGIDEGLVCNYGTMIPIMFSFLSQIEIDSKPYLVPYVCCLTTSNLSESSSQKYGSGWDAQIGFGFIQVPVLCLSSAIYDQGDMYVIQTALQKMYLEKEMLDYLAIDTEYLKIPFSNIGRSKKARDYIRVMTDTVKNSFKNY